MADGAGGLQQSWVPLGTLWAWIRPGSGRQRTADAATLSGVPYRIVVKEDGEIESHYVEGMVETFTVN